MTITVDATIESGQLKLKEPVVLAEGTPVRVTITPVDAPRDPFAALVGMFCSGRTDGAENHDQYLNDQYLNDQYLNDQYLNDQYLNDQYLNDKRP